MRFNELTRSEQNILSLCREVGFGSLSDLAIRGGEIRTTPATRKRLSVLFGRPSTPAKAGAAGDFELNANQEGLVRDARSRRDALVVRLEIQNGLPVQANIEEAIAE